MADKKLSIRLETKLSELETLRSALEGFGAETDMYCKDAFALNLVLDELFTNIVSYGFDDEQPGRYVDISLEKTGRDVSVVVEDNGKPFNPLTVSPPDTTEDLEARTAGGIGIHLAKNMMDHLDYRRLGDKNILKLKKRLDQSVCKTERKGDSMETTESKQGDVATFHLKGRLDSNTSIAFEETVFKSIDAGNRKLVMDFADLDYISSAGLRVILKAAKNLKKTEGELVLCAMQDYVKEVFEISGFDTFLQIAPSVDDGIRHFSNDS